MTRHAPTLPVVLFAAICAASAPCTAQDPLDWSVPPVDPMRLSSLPMRLSDGSVRPRNAWTFEGTVGYFNLASPSWHIATIHRELGLEGQPLDPSELRTLETRHPSDDIYNLDVEGWQFDLHVSRSFGAGYTISVHVPWMDVGHPNWDAISSDFHRAFGIGQGPRDALRNGDTMVYLYSGGRVVERTGDIAGSGLGDISLAASGPVGRVLGGDQRWAVAVDAPTGSTDGLWGSGGWDLGVRWFGDWRFGRSRLQLAAGYNWLDDSGSWLGIERSDIWQAQGVFFYRIAESSSLRLSVWYGSSILADFSDGQPGDPSLFFDIGARFGLSSRWWFALNLGENHIDHGTAPDFTLQLQLGTSFDRAP